MISQFIFYLVEDNSSLYPTLNRALVYIKISNLRKRVTISIFKNDLKYKKEILKSLGFNSKYTIVKTYE